MKPALQYLFIHAFYAREHDRLPGHDINGRKRLHKKRRSVILSWWKRLPTAKRSAYIAIAEAQISSFNSELRTRQNMLRVAVADIQAKITLYKSFKNRRKESIL